MHGKYTRSDRASAPALVRIVGGATRVAATTASRVSLQTTFATAPPITWDIAEQRAARISPEENPEVPFGTGCQIADAITPQAHPETGLGIDFRKPFGVALDTPSGTVPGTVPLAVREVQFLASVEWANGLCLRGLGQFRPASPLRGQAKTYSATSCA